VTFCAEIKMRLSAASYMAVPEIATSCFHDELGLEGLLADLSGSVVTGALWNLIEL
jgi:hypothetical protein